MLCVLENGVKKLIMWTQGLCLVWMSNSLRSCVFMKWTPGSSFNLRYESYIQHYSHCGKVCTKCYQLKLTRTGTMYCSLLINLVWRYILVHTAGSMMDSADRILLVRRDVTRSTMPSKLPALHMCQKRGYHIISCVDNPSRSAIQ